MNSNLQHQVQQPIFNQPPQPPPQQPNVFTQQQQQSFSNPLKTLPNDNQRNIIQTEIPVSNTLQQAPNNSINPIGGFNNPQKVVIPTDISLNKNIPRRNTVSAKSSNSVALLIDQAVENKCNSNTQSAAQQNLTRTSSVGPSSSVQFLQNINSQIQYNQNEQHARTRRLTEIPVNNQQPQNQQQKPRRISEMQPGHPQNQGLTNLHSQASQQQQYQQNTNSQRTPQSFPNQSRPSQIQQNIYQQQPIQTQTYQAQSNSNQLRQTNHNYPYQNQQNQNQVPIPNRPYQNPQNLNQPNQNQMQQQPPLNHQFRPRRQTTKGSQPYGLPRNQQINLMNRHQPNEYYGQNSEVFRENEGIPLVTRSSSSLSLLKQVEPHKISPRTNVPSNLPKPGLPIPQQSQVNLQHSMSIPHFQSQQPQSFPNMPNVQPPSQQAIPRISPHQQQQAIPQKPQQQQQRTIPQIPPQQQTIPQIPPQQQTIPQIPPQQQTIPQIPPQQQTIPQIPPQQQTIPQIPQQQQQTIPQIPQQQQQQTIPQIPQQQQQQQTIPQIPQQQQTIPQIPPPQQTIPQIPQQQQTIPQIPQQQQQTIPQIPQQQQQQTIPQIPQQQQQTIPQIPQKQQQTIPQVPPRAPSPQFQIKPEKPILQFTQQQATLQMQAIQSPQQQAITQIPPRVPSPQFQPNPEKPILPFFQQQTTPQMPTIQTPPQPQDVPRSSSPQSQSYTQFTPQPQNTSLNLPLSLDASPPSSSSMQSPIQIITNSPPSIQTDFSYDQSSINLQQTASSAPSISPMQSQLIIPSNSSQRVSFDESVTAIIGGKLFLSDEANQSSSDGPQDIFKIRKNINNAEPFKNSSDNSKNSQLSRENSYIAELIDETMLSNQLMKPVNDEECQKSDLTVNKLINDQCRNPKNGFKWFGYYVVSCSFQQNPYLDNLALDFSSKPEYKNNRTVKLFSESMRHLKLNPVNEELSSRVFSPLSNVLFYHDAILVQDKSKIIPIVKKPVPTAQNCYMRKFKADHPVFQVKDLTPFPLPKRRFLNLSLISFDFNSSVLEKVEPFFMCGYLVNNGEMITEPWFFGPSDTKQFNPEIKLNQNGSFELPTVALSEVYLVVLILRKLLPENGAVINKYYKSPGSKTLAAAKEQAKFRLAYPGVFAPFAWTFLTVDTIVRTKSQDFKMPQPFAINGLIKPLYRSLKSVSGPTLPIEITFKLSLQNDVTLPYQLTFTNDCVLPLISYPPETPRFSFHHNLYIRIVSVALHSKKRNIYAHITLKKDETELPLIYYPYRIGKSTKNFTKCWYHEKKPIFDDFFVISLPNPIPPDFMIYIKLYNAVLKNLSSNGKANAAVTAAAAAAAMSNGSSSNLQEPNPSTSELIGIAKIPLINDDGDFIPDGIQNFGVLHTADNQFVPGCLTLETHLNSSIISSNPNLNHFYNKINAETMAQIDVNDTVVNLFNLLDQLVIGMITEPEDSIKALVELSRKVAASKPVDVEKTNFSNFATRFACSFAFRSDQTTTPAFHRNLLHNWALLMEADLNHRIALRAQSQLNIDQNNSTNNSNSNVNSSSHILPMSNLSLSSSAANMKSDQISHSSSGSQIGSMPPSPRNSPNQNIPRSSSLSSQVLSGNNSPRNSTKYINSDGGKSQEAPESSDNNVKLKDNSTSSTILSSEILNKLQADLVTIPNTERCDFYLIDFFFLLIIKSIYLTNDREFGNEFSEFIISWTKSFNKDQIESYSIFINLLFDIGYCTFACHAISKQVNHIILTKQSSELLLPFIRQVIRPRLFYPSVLLIDDFVSLINTVVYYSRSHKEIFEQIFDILLRIVIHYSDQMNKDVTSRLMDIYTTLSHFNKLPIKSEQHSAIYFYTYLFHSTTFEAFQEWISKQTPETITSFFQTIQSLLNFIKDKELARVYHFALLNILTHVMAINNKEYVLYTSYIVYNLFCLNLSMDFIPDLITFFGKFVNLYYLWLVESSVPPIARHIIKILGLSCYCPNEVNEFVTTLIEVDKKNFNNTRRSMSILCRSLIHVMNIKDLTIFENSELYPIVHCLKEYEKQRKLKISEEKLVELKINRAMTLIHSPDAAIQCIDNLISFHEENEYYAEELQTRIFKIALVFEYIGCTGVMDYKYLNVQRPSLLFAEECPSIKQFIRCPEDGMFRIPSYCDSPPFSEHSLISDILYLVKRSIETKLYEIGIKMIDKFWPIIEHHSNYALVSQTFQTFSRCYEESASIPSEVDRLFGRYYRVSFYGKCFEGQDGKNFIYREKKLTHLFEISKRLTDFYSDLYQPTQVELIKEAGAVELSSLDLENKGYIQVTFVEPSFQKSEKNDRITPYERNHLLKDFYFDTPFTKVEGGKAQSTVDQQWIRRTVLTVKYEMPSISKRAKIIKETEREFAPIRVAYRQLRERINLLENAITQYDYRNIQQLLHGSLLVQVNEGPSRMAELFLGEQSEKSKYTDKLKNAFNLFLKVNEKALDMHSKWVTDHPEFAPLQHELESGLSSLVEKLTKWI